MDPTTSADLQRHRPQPASVTAAVAGERVSLSVRTLVYGVTARLSVHLCQYVGLKGTHGSASGYIYNMHM